MLYRQKKDKRKLALAHERLKKLEEYRIEDT